MDWQKFRQARAKTAPVKVETSAPPKAKGEISLPEDLKAAFEEIKRPKADGLERNARATVYKMFVETKGELDVPYTFKTAKFGGEAYVQAMRMVLSRGKNDLRKKNLKVSQFRFFLVSLDQKPDHDLVTVMRSKHSSLKQKTVYDDFAEYMAETVEESQAMGRVKDKWMEDLEKLFHQVRTKQITRREAHKILSRGPMEFDDIEEWLDEAEKGN